MLAATDDSDPQGVKEIGRERVFPSEARPLGQR